MAGPGWGGNGAIAEGLLAIANDSQYHSPQQETSTMPPSLSRRRLGALAAALLAAPPVLAQRVPTTVITDIAGRRVEVPRGAKRMVLGEGRLLAATVLLDRDKP